jgi:hypothetical protein
MSEGGIAGIAGKEKSEVGPLMTQPPTMSYRGPTAARAPVLHRYERELQAPKFDFIPLAAR